MSTTVDERVVEMRFDNDQFESNVNESMSTLAKLKQSLKLTGASKGLEAVNTAAKKVNFTPIVNGMDQVTTRFSHAQMTIQHQIDRWADRIVGAAERGIKALTIDPVKTGFQEYETQINAVQTILANTSSKGSTIDDVNKALEELNKYADKTIYNFTEMTRNIGTFTAAGVDLETSTNAIQGIANLAAVSGSTSQQASTAMYQLSQALASGTVKLMDWNSVVNAGMGGEVFQNALKETARVHGIAIDDMIKSEGSFRETLSKGWLTSEILTETLQKFTLTTEGLTEEQIEANKQMLKAKGYTEDQIEEIFKLGRTATDAATKVKTFTQLWDVLKESAQSGWSQTWKLLIGDFEEAKAFLTPLADFLTGALGKMSDFRNAILEKALNNPFTDTLKSISGLTNGIGEAVKSITDYNKIVDEIIGGKWGDGQARWDKLAEAGYDWAHAQNLVNEKLGSSVRRATEYKEAQEGVAKTHQMSIEQLAGLNDEVLRVLGYTEEQIAALNFLEEQSKKTGIPIEELAKDLDLLSGRSLLLNSFKNIGKSLVDVFTEIRWAWRDIFHGEGTTDEEIINKRAMQIYDLIAAFHKFTTTLEVDSDKADKLRRTFKGLFAIIDIITTLVGGGFKIAFNLIKSVLKYFNVDVLDLTANIGDVLVKFRDWMDSVLNFDGAVSKVIPIIVKGAKAVKGWGEAFVELPFVQKVITAITDAFSKLADIDLKNINIAGIFTSIKNAFNTLKGEKYSSIGEFIWDGLIIGLGKGVVNAVKAIANGAQQLIAKFCEITGIASPSKVFMALGGFIIAGLILGIKEGAIAVPETLKQIVEAGLQAIQNIDFGKVMAAGLSIGLLAFFNKIGTALKNFSEPFGAIGDVLEQTADAIKRVSKSFSKMAKAIAFNQNMKGIKQLAIAIAILAGTVIAIAYLGKDNWSDIWIAVGVIGTLAVMLVGLAVSMNLLSKASLDISKNGIKMDGMTTSLLAIAGAMAILALTVKLISGLDWKQAVGGFAGLTVLMGLLIGFVWLCGKVGDYKSAAVVGKLSGLLTKLAISLILMVWVCKLVGKLERGEMIKGGLFAAAFLVFIGILADLTRNSSDMSKVGGMMIKLAIAMALMVLVCKLVGKLDPVDAIAGFAFAMAFGLFVKALVKSTKIASNQQIAKLGGLLMSVSLSMLLMVALCKLVGKLSGAEMLKGAAFAGGFLLLVWALVSITKISSEQKMAKVSGTILAVSGAIAILALVAIILSLMDVADLAKGVIAVGALGLLMMGLIKSLKGAQNVSKSIMWMAIAIGILAASIGLLSFIDPNKLIAPTIAMGLLMGMFALIIKCSKNVKNSWQAILTITIVMALMAGLLILLSKLEVQNAIQNAAAVSLLMVAMAGVLFILSKMKIKALDAVKAIGLLTLMVVPMAAFVAMIHFMPDIASAKAKIALLITTMAAMTILLGILTVIGTFGIQAITGVALLTAMVIPMAAFVAVIHFMPDIAGAKDKVLLLTTLMTAMTILLAALTVIGVFAIPALVGIGLLTAMVIPMAVFVAAMYFMPDITGARANIELLIQTMTAMVGLLVVLALVGPLASIGIGALTSLTGLMGAIGLMAVAIGALVELFPSLQTFLDTGLDLLIKLAGGIGEMVGAFIGGAFTQIAASLPDIGTSLSEFMKNVTPFVEGLRQIDQSVIESAKSLAGIIIALTGAELISGITAWLTGNDGVNFETLGSSLRAFAKAVIDFSNTITENGGINPDSVNAAVKAGELMLKLQNALPRTGGWIQDIIGEKDLTKFGASCVAFGKAMIEFGDAIEVGGGIKESIIGDAAKAGTAMSELQKSLPRTGGWIQQICGEQDLVAFGNSCVAFGKAMCRFSRAVEEGGGINDEAAKDAKKAGELLLALQDTLPRTGGWIQEICGEQDLAAFGASCLAFGEALTTFSNNVTISDEAVEAATRAGNMMTELQNNIPTDTWFDGKVNLEDFGKTIVNYGEKLVDYSDIVYDMDTDAVSDSLNATLTLVNIAKALQGISSTASALSLAPIVDIGTKLKDFGTKMAEVDMTKLGSSVDIAARLKNVVTNLANIDTSGVDKFKSAIETLSQTNFSDLTSAFEGSSDKLATIGSDIVKFLCSGMENQQGNFNATANKLIKGLSTAITSKEETFATAGKNLIDKFMKALGTGKKGTTDTMKEIVTACLASARNQVGAFISAGSNLAEGFANGISANSYKAAAQAKAMAEAAKKAAEEALGIASPSKVFYTIGDYTGQGFINALAGYASKAYRSATDMGNSARSGLNDALSKAYDIINGDLETQPTIRPVLDLSSVEAGASRMNGLLNGVSNVGVMTNMNAIGSMMEQRRQNGSNADVVSAIDKLRKKMDNFGNTTYQVGNVTAEEGSGVATAVESLVGAIRREGRA